MALVLKGRLVFIWCNKSIYYFFSLIKSDDHDETEIEKIKQEITQLHNSIFQEIYHEREEYVSIWFSEILN